MAATAVSAAAVASSASPATASPSAMPAAPPSPAASAIPAASSSPAVVADAPSPPPAAAQGARRFTPKAERWVGTPALGYVLVGRTDGEDAEEPGESIRAMCNAQRLHLRRIVRDMEVAPRVSRRRARL